MIRWRCHGLPGWAPLLASHRGMARNGPIRLGWGAGAPGGSCVMRDVLAVPGAMDWAAEPPLGAGSPLGGRLPPQGRMGPSLSGRSPRHAPPSPPLPQARLPQAPLLQTPWLQVLWLQAFSLQAFCLQPEHCPGGLPSGQGRAPGLRGGRRHPPLSQPGSCPLQGGLGNGSLPAPAQTRASAGFSTPSLFFPLLPRP